MDKDETITFLKTELQLHRRLIENIRDILSVYTEVINGEIDQELQTQIAMFKILTQVDYKDHEIHYDEGEVK